MIEPRGFDDLTPDEQDEEALPEHRGIHHTMPMPYGLTELDALTPPSSLPPIDLDAARMPRSPGMPPLMHIPLPKPEAYLPAAPFAPIPAHQPSRSPLTPIERVPFPIAEPLGFRRLSPVPTVVVDAPAAPLRESTPAAQGQGARPVRHQEHHPAGTLAERPAVLERFDPLYGLAIYIALEIGTLVLVDIEARYVALWSILAFIGGALTLLETRESLGRITSANLAWGALIGLGIGLPLLALVRPGLSAASRFLFPYPTLPGLFQTVVLLWPLGETMFFRGVLQIRHGIIASVIGMAATTLVFFWPAGSHEPLLLGALTLFLAMLAGICSYVRQRHGLAAAYACQVMLNVLLVFLPRAIAPPLP